MVENATIVRAGVHDVKMLAQLSVKTFVDTFAESNRKEDMDMYLAEEMNEQKLSEELGYDDNRFFFVLYNNIHAGYAKMRTAKRPEELKDNNPIELERIYVLKEYQGKKLGALLMKHCVETAVKNGFDVLWLGVWEQNHTAVNFYKKWGFQLFGSHQFRLGDDIQTDVLMRKYLV